MREALENEDKAVARRVIQQFVAKIVIKNGTGTLYYTFPFPDDLYRPRYGNLDLRGTFPYTRHIHAFDVPLPDTTQSDLRHPDKDQLHATILELRNHGMSYRQIAQHVNLHFTRVHQIIQLGQQEAADD